MVWRVTPPRAPCDAQETHAANGGDLDIWLCMHGSWAERLLPSWALSHSTWRLGNGADCSYEKLRKPDVRWATDPFRTIRENRESSHSRFSRLSLRALRSP